MEKIKIEKPEAEKEKGYHHPEIAEIEPAMTDLVEKLKEKIDNEEYDTIISDDVGGRIPSLILRKIIRDRNPSQKIGTYFVVGGHAIRSEDQQEVVKEFLKKKEREVKKRALLVTEFVHSGKSIKILGNLMEEVGIDFDVAALYTWGSNMGVRHIPPHFKTFVGSSEPQHKKGSLGIHHKSSKLAGVEKKREVSPHPTLYENMLPIMGKPWTEEQEKQFSDLCSKYVRATDEIKKQELKRELDELGVSFEQKSKQISDEDLKQLNEDIKNARADVNTMVENIIDRVWVD